MATQNQIASGFWIIKRIGITHGIFHKQNCLCYASEKRVGIIPERLKSLENAGLFGYGIAP
jgi:hypothetical protein